MSPHNTAIVAGGCFWCTEAVFRQVDGVLDVESGYIGGENENPTYKQVCSGTTGHAEAIKITFDPDVLKLDDLLDLFMATHDPSQLNGQGNDRGTQYRSAIFPLDSAQQEAADAAIARWNADNGNRCVTTIEGLIEGTQTHPWYRAEDYHQEYWDGEGQRNSYCLAVIPPKLAKLKKALAKK